MVVLWRNREISYSSDAAVLKIQGPLRGCSFCLGAQSSVDVQRGQACKPLASPSSVDLKQ